MSLSSIATLDVFQEFCLKVAACYHTGSLTTGSRSIASTSVPKYGDAASSSRCSTIAETQSKVLGDVLSSLNCHFLDDLNPNLSPLTAQEILQPSVLKLFSQDGTRRGLEKQLLAFTGQRIGLYQQTRGFRTRRLGSIGIGRSASDEPSLVQRTLERLRKPSQSRRLDEITQEFASQPEVQDKLKVAFAEGYKASDGMAARPSNMERFLRISSYVVTIWLLFMVIRLISSSSNGRGSGLSFMSSDSYEVNPEVIKTSFSDVKGADEAMYELKEIVEFLRNPESFRKLGAKLPKGVLLVGPPGNGKTLLAKAVAGEANVPFFHASGSQFEEVFVGTGARRVRQLFAAAKERAPCVLFIDEIDSVGAKRTSSEIHPYANQTINQLLAEMDGFEPNEGVIVLGATNRRDNLDKALLRPGRFDLEVRVFPPDLKGRSDIIALYLDKVRSDPDIDVELLARTTVGFSGAELENLVNQAALRAALDGSEEVTNVHLEFARDKVMMGPEWKNRKPDAESLRRTAYHEAGHTLVSIFTKESHPIHKVTIIPRGMALGVTASVPEKDVMNQTRSQLLAEMDMCMGGRVAEELMFGIDHVSTGASSDFEKATRIATAMVKHFGMSEKVGPRTIEDASGPSDSGLALVRVNELSPGLSEIVDAEVKRLLSESYERAKQVLRSHQRELEIVAQQLLQNETLTGDQVKALIDKA